MTVRYILLGWLIFPLFAYSAVLTGAEEKAKQQGMIAFNQYKFSLDNMM